MSALYDDALAPVGVNVGQWALLRRLHRADTALSIQSLADVLELERSTVARNVRVLVKAGLVRMAASAEDRRATEVTLTPQGTAALEEGAPLWAAAQRRVEQMLNGADAAGSFRALLSTLQPTS